MVSCIVDGCRSHEDVLESADVGDLILHLLHSKEGVSEPIVGLERWLQDTANKLVATCVPRNFVEDSAFGKPLCDE